MKNAQNPSKYACNSSLHSISTDFTSGVGRSHFLSVILTPSTYLDNTDLNSKFGVLTRGYKAGFASYTAVVDPTATQVTPTPSVLPVARLAMYLPVHAPYAVRPPRIDSLFFSGL